MNYEPKFIEGMTIEKIDEEIREWYEDQYRYGRLIDYTRICDLEHTKRTLKEREV